MEIKKREVLFSIIIILLMIFLGLFISEEIFEGASRTAEKYATATAITNEEQFRYGMDTNFGDTLVYGEIATTSPVTYPEIGNGYIYIEKNQEKYQVHTRVVTYTDSEGHTHTRTETYWSWDRVWSDSKHSETILLLNVEFPYETIGLPVHRLDLSSAGVENRGNYIYEDSHTRYYYAVTPVVVTGTVFAEMKDKTINAQSRLYENQTPDQVVEDKYKSQKWVIIAFWVFWTLLIGGCVYGFLYFDNRWLD